MKVEGPARSQQNTEERCWCLGQGGGNNGGGKKWLDSGCTGETG